jgi:hypothetical protein
LVLSVLTLCVGVSGLQAQADAQAVKVVNYEELGKEVKRHQGKVVVVDFWHTD